MYKVINNIAYQIDYGDISRCWFLCIAKPNETKPIIELKFKTKKDALNVLNKIITETNNKYSKMYKLPCGHDNAVKLNVWPFKTWVCCECNLRTDIINEVTQ